MKSRTSEQIEHEADLHPGPGMSRREHLERWAEALERQPARRLTAIQGTEFGTVREREAKHADNFPLTVAFENPRRGGDRARAPGGCVASPLLAGRGVCAIAIASAQQQLVAGADPRRECYALAW